MHECPGQYTRILGCVLPIPRQRERSRGTRVRYQGPKWVELERIYLRDCSSCISDVRHSPGYWTINMRFRIALTAGRAFAIKTSGIYKGERRAATHTRKKDYCNAVEQFCSEQCTEAQGQRNYALEFRPNSRMNFDSGLTIAGQDNDPINYCARRIESAFLDMVPGGETHHRSGNTRLCNPGKRHIRSLGYGDARLR